MGFFNRKKHKDAEPDKKNETIKASIEEKGFNGNPFVKPIREKPPAHSKTGKLKPLKPMVEYKFFIFDKEGNGRLFKKFYNRDIVELLHKEIDLTERDDIYKIVLEVMRQIFRPNTVILKENFFEFLRVMKSEMFAFCDDLITIMEEIIESNEDIMAIGLMGEFENYNIIRENTHNILFIEGV